MPPSAAPGHFWEGGNHLGWGELGKNVPKPGKMPQILSENDPEFHRNPQNPGRNSLPPPVTKVPSHPLPPWIHRYFYKNSQKKPGFGIKAPFVGPRLGLAAAVSGKLWLPCEAPRSQKNPGHGAPCAARGGGCGPKSRKMPQKTKRCPKTRDICPKIRQKCPKSRKDAPKSGIDASKPVKMPQKIRFPKIQGWDLKF